MRSELQKIPGLFEQMQRFNIGKGDSAGLRLLKKGRRGRPFLVCRCALRGASTAHTEGQDRTRRRNRPMRKRPCQG